MSNFEKVWIARAENEEHLQMFDEEPRRGKPPGDGMWYNTNLNRPSNDGNVSLPHEWFPFIKWENEPLQFDLVPSGLVDKQAKIIKALRDKLDSYPA